MGLNENHHSWHSCSSPYVEKLKPATLSCVMSWERYLQESPSLKAKGWQSQPTRSRASPQCNPMLWSRASHPIQWSRASLPQLPAHRSRAHQTTGTEPMELSPQTSQTFVARHLQPMNDLWIGENVAKMISPIIMRQSTGSLATWTLQRGTLVRSRIPQPR